MPPNTPRSDPLARPRATRETDDLFAAIGPARAESTSDAAHLDALRVAGDRYAAILAALERDGPLALWQIAERIGKPDHAISGRITELKRRGAIEPTGERRRRNGTGSPAEVYRLARRDPPPPPPPPPPPDPSPPAAPAA